MAKPKYEYWLSSDGLILLEAWAREGLTDEQIAKNMGIVRSTLNVWKEQFSVISDALKRTKAIVDAEVENALFKRAMGFTYEEVTYRYGVEVRRVKKIVPPDTTAQIFWLKNRKPSEWRDRQREGMTDTSEDPLAGLNDAIERAKGALKK